MVQSSSESLGTQTQTIFANPPGKVDSTPALTWWSRYEETLSITQTARKVLDDDSSYIFTKGVCPNVNSNEEITGSTRYRSGLIVGAVQSGKTASMIGVMAKALDASYDVVVLLAGTRISLWNQTYTRVQEQLRPRAEDIFLPSKEVMDRASRHSVSLNDLFSTSSARIKRSLNDRTPIIMVVMKHDRHLRAAREFLHERVFSQMESFDREFRMLILDDEADDGSVLDADVEFSMDPNVTVLKQIPRHIVDLWSERTSAPETCKSNLQATYVAYTATPQANTLQMSQNPLSPRDFVIALRTPSNEGAIVPRHVSYREIEGHEYYYYGAKAFYRDISNPKSLILTEDDVVSDPENCAPQNIDWIKAAIRNYLVSCAIGLWRDNWSGNLTEMRLSLFPSFIEAQNSFPKPHSMLFHPSALTNEHFAAAAEIQAWAGNIESDLAIKHIEQGFRDLGLKGLIVDLNENPDDWFQVFQTFAETSKSVANAYSIENPPASPVDEDWDSIKAIILNTVLPNVRLSIINSDPRADDRPNFVPVETDQGWRAPLDIFTIFISGNVMSRGLTLEGLATSLFLRTSDDPLADTQMQMQRWFGYRGKIIDLCRVLIPKNQLGRFVRYYEGDLVLRLQVIAAMNADPAVAPKPTVIEGVDYRATGKIFSPRRITLCPGPSPFMHVVNAEEETDPNMEVVRHLFEEPSLDVVAGGVLRGRILEKPVDLLKAANILDSLSFPQLNFDGHGEEHSRWSALSEVLSPDASSSSSLNLYRYQCVNPKAKSIAINPFASPYTIAAYLRFWNAALTRRTPGLVATDDGQMPWSELDLAVKASQAPNFYIGIRYGSGRTLAGSEGWTFDVQLMERALEGEHLQSRWGTRRPTVDYLGDQSFDYAHHNDPRTPLLMPGGSVWRPKGAPGLMLFHLIDRGESKSPLVAVGMSVPIGGPDQFAARSRG